MSDVLAQGGIGNTIKQIGNTVIWNRPDGASHVIGMLDQITSDIDGLEIAQQGIQVGLSGLKSLSMVTLGFSGISVALLASQFVFLTRRLNAIQKSLGRIEIKITQQIEAKLETGLTFLRAADDAKGDQRIHNYREALNHALESAHFFRQQAIDPNINQEQLELIQFYARKYFLGLSIELGSLVGLDQPDAIKVRLNDEEKYLKTIASQIYKHTLSTDLESYLAPEMRDFVTLESIAGILEQAQNLGCIPRETGVSPAEIFEANRKSIYSRGLRRMGIPTFDASRRASVKKLHSAQSSFEEITRLLSWREAIGYLSQNGRSPTEVANEVRHFRTTLETPTNSTPFVAYSVTPSET